MRDPQAISWGSATAMFALGQKADIALRSHAISALPPKSDVAGRFAGPPFEGVVEATNVRVA